MLPTAWAALLEQIKPYGETDFAGVLKGAGDLLGLTSAQITEAGRSIASIGDVRDFTTATTIDLPHSDCTFSAVWGVQPTPEHDKGLAALASVLDLALIAKDRRIGEVSTPMMAPAGSKDRLTSTIDRDAFIDYLDIEFGAGPSNATVMAVGLDGMSVVNDTMSHTVGDVVIAETADRLRATLRSCDIVSRLGGDVFGIYCPNMDIATAQKLAVRLQAAISRPIKVQSNELRVTAGVGISSRGKGEKARETISNGDTALHAAKAQGAGQLVIFDGAIRMRTEDRRLLATELVEALDQNQLVTGMEPIVHLPGGSIVGVEAHVAWQHPIRGEINRSEFMDLAELIGRAADVERAVLEFALTAQPETAMRTGVNVSASTLRDPLAVDWMCERLKTSGSQIIVEVGEASISTGGQVVMRHLAALRTAGASIVLDDFGLSFASLRTLHAFDFDGVKLHTSLLSEGNSTRMTAIIKGVYAGAAAVGFDVVHSGVDSDADLRLLMSLDDTISGHGFYAQGSAVRARVEAAAAAS